MRTDKSNLKNTANASGIDLRFKEDNKLVTSMQEGMKNKGADEPVKEKPISNIERLVAQNNAAFEMMAASMNKEPAERKPKEIHGEVTSRNKDGSIKTFVIKEI